MAMQAAIPASSIRPYIWIVIGPRSSVPEDGEGIDARSVTADRIVPSRADGVRKNYERHASGAPTRARAGRSRALPGGSPAVGASEQDLERQFWGAAVPEQVDRVVQIDIRATGEEQGGGRLVAGPLELFGAPALDSLLFRLGGRLSRSHFGPSWSCVSVVRPVNRRGCPPCRGLR